MSARPKPHDWMVRGTPIDARIWRWLWVWSEAVADWFGTRYMRAMQGYWGH